MVSISIDDFNPKGNSITAYMERVTLHFQANEMSRGKQVAMF